MNKRSILNAAIICIVIAILGFTVKNEQREAGAVVISVETKMNGDYRVYKHGDSYTWANTERLDGTLPTVLDAYVKQGYDIVSTSTIHLLDANRNSHRTTYVLTK